MPPCNCSVNVPKPIDRLQTAPELRQTRACCLAGMAGYFPACALFSDLSGGGSIPEVREAVTAVLDGRRLALYSDRAACIARWLIMRADEDLIGVSIDHKLAVRASQTAQLSREELRHAAALCTSQPACRCCLAQDLDAALLVTYRLIALRIEVWRPHSSSVWRASCRGCNVSSAPRRMCPAP
jgi:hypothetical protein